MTQTTIRIGVLGTHSTGKTMLLKRIEMELRGHGVTVARTGRLAKRAAALGLPKMQHHTGQSTEWIIARGIADEIEAEQGAGVVLVDRASLDAVAYLRAALEYRGEVLHRGELERLRLLAGTQAPKYDLLLATVLDPDVPVDKSHDYDDRFRRLVDKHVHSLLAEDEFPHQRVTSDSESQTRAIERALQLCLQEAAV
ncbi:ATP-binding protein [Streptomyces sp. NBC_00554]|uniref:AAA family ATPase n=1 Tax=Streptomyces sp. NBC_00554 TaxID=2903661 RepID=UPI00352E7830|nr:ATP-binding protein [Streptomyces sp. NBC_00554]